MKTKKYIFFIAALLLIMFVIKYAYIPAKSVQTENLRNKVPELVLNSNDLINAYLIDEEKSNNIYAGKIIEVTGYVEETTLLNNRNTIILASKNKSFGIICDINPNFTTEFNQVQKNQKIRVKGICKGFLKDVILLNCSIELTPNE